MTTNGEEIRAVPEERCGSRTEKRAQASGQARWEAVREEEHAGCRWADERPRVYVLMANTPLIKPGMKPKPIPKDKPLAPTGVFLS